MKQNPYESYLIGVFAVPSNQFLKGTCERSFIEVAYKDI